MITQLLEMSLVLEVVEPQIKMLVRHMVEMVEMVVELE